MEKVVANWNSNQRIYLLKWLHTDCAFFLPKLFAHDGVEKQQIFAVILVNITEKPAAFEQPNELAGLSRLSICYLHED